MSLCEYAQRQNEFQSLPFIVVCTFVYDYGFWLFDRHQHGGEGFLRIPKAIFQLERYIVGPNKMFLIAPPNTPHPH